jgi:hypothetical protein
LKPSSPLFLFFTIKVFTLYPKNSAGITENSTAEALNATIFTGTFHPNIIFKADR